MKAKDKLGAAVSAFINEDVEQTQKMFHEYLRQKTRAILMNENEDEDEDDDKEEKDDDKEDDKEDKKDDKSSKKSKKDEEDEEHC